MKASKGAIKRGPAGDNDYSMLLGVAWMASKEFLKPAEWASKSAGRASEPVMRASTTVGTSWKGLQTNLKGLQTKWRSHRVS